MTEYSRFTKDFVTRTKNILESYTGNYEVTNLINCCLGLLIIPKQAVGCDIPTYTFDNEDCTYGITRHSIKYEENSDYALGTIWRHIRNGLSHGRIDQNVSDGEIIGLRIHDKKDSNSNENFVVEFTVEEFRVFAINISKLIQ